MKPISYYKKFARGLNLIVFAETSC